MSKINSAVLDQAVSNILAFAEGKKIDTMVKGKKVEVQGKKRNFVETIELQATLKNWDPKKMKRFSGTYKLPVAPKKEMKLCVLANAVHEKAAEELNVDFMTVDDMKKLNKDKKLVKKLAKKYDAFLASDTVIKLIPRLLGPGLNRAGKFPTRVASADDLGEAIDELQKTIKYQMKKVMCLNLAVGNVEMSDEEIKLNVQLAANFLVSLLKKGWQNIKVLYIKSSMGPVQQIYF